MQIIFGSQTIIPCIDLPTNIIQVQKNIGPIPPCDSGVELARLGTLFPYHRPFLSNEQGRKALHILLNGGGIGLKTLIGRVANGFGANVSLRHCPLCAVADLAQYGMSYWHRSHHLPGVTSCYLHGINLCEHIEIDIARHRQQIVLAPSIVDPVRRANKSDSRQENFAKISHELLFSSLLEIAPSHRTSVYENGLRNLGLSKSKRRIDLNGLVHELRSFHNNFEGYCCQDRLLSSQLQPMRWVREIFARPSRAIHPICHLLLIEFLFKDIATFRDKLMGCQGAEISDKDEVISRKKSKLPFDPDRNKNKLSDVGISCRLLAQELCTSVTSIVQLRRRMGILVSERSKTITQTKRKNVHDKLRSGMSPVSVSEQENLSVSTVYRLLHESPEVEAVHKKIKGEQELDRCRKLWKHLCKKHRKEGVTKIRSLASATYHWLYRNDKAWLKEMCNQVPKKRVKPKNRVDWKKRDITLRKKLIAYVAKLTSQVNHPRISKSLMLRRIGDAMARRNVVRLPTLWKEIHNQEESVQSYQIRRLERVMATYLIDESCSLSMILRKAGIGKLDPILTLHLKKKFNFTDC